MSYDISIFDTIQTDDQRKKLLYQLKNEQFIIAYELKKEQKIANKIAGEERKEQIREYKKKLEYQKIQKQALKFKNGNDDGISSLHLSFNTNESLLQAELYHQCKKRQIQCFLEVGMLSDNNKLLGRIDAIIKFKGKSFGIECKQNFRKNLVNVKNQLMRYQRLNIPIFILEDLAHIYFLIDAIKHKTLYKKIYFFETHDNSLNILQLDDL